MIATVSIWALAIVLSIAGLLGLVLPALPGPALLFAGLLAAAWAEHFAYVGTITLVVLAVLAILAHVLDFVAGSIGAKRYGASGRAVFGAAIGAIVGMFFGVFGLLLGPFIGAMLGELSARSDLASASRAGIGATIGMIVGTAAKLALGITMVGLYLFVRLVVDASS
ncbi:MAG TPA: DUF456 domain-containing protein [Gammaproteobacteria bacterium]|nr:DUF456 domain-containing protein [Gammaproteobacteria bacterium]